jgi:hypothetical protein
MHVNWCAEIWSRAACYSMLWAALWIVPTTAPAADDPALLKDLTSVIALLGLPCGQVVSAKPQKGDDHIAICQDGNSYRVFINADGRVVAQSLRS